MSKKNGNYFCSWIDLRDWKFIKHALERKTSPKELEEFEGQDFNKITEELIAKVDKKIKEEMKVDE